MSKEITQEELDALLNSAEGNIDVKKLLADNDFVPNLNGIKINLPEGGREIALSDLNISNCSFGYKPPYPTKVDFTESNLEDCSLALVPGFLSLGSANLQKCHGIIAQDSLELTGAKADMGFTIIQDKLPQNLLLKSHSEILDPVGVCQGLVIEYGRLVEKYGESTPNTSKGPMEKFRRKLDKEKGAKFAKRIQSYFSLLQAMPDSEPLDNLLQDPNVNTIAINVRGAGHAMEITKVKNEDGKIKGYTIYDPNLGETTLLESKDDLEHALGNFAQFCAAAAGIDASRDVSLEYHNLTKLVKSLNLTNKKDYSLLIDAIAANQQDKVIEFLSGMDLSDNFYGKKVMSNAISNPDVSNSTIFTILDNSNFPIESMKDYCTGTYVTKFSNELLDGLLERGLKFSFKDFASIHKAIRFNNIDIRKDKLEAVTLKALDSEEQIEREDALNLLNFAPEMISPKLLEKFQKKDVAFTIKDCKKIQKLYKKAKCDIKEQLSHLKSSAILRDKGIDSEDIIEAMIASPNMIESPLLKELEKQERGITPKDIEQYKNDWGDSKELEQIEKGLPKKILGKHTAKIAENEIAHSAKATSKTA